MNALASQAHQHYQKMQIESASPAKLILMLYDGAIRKLGQAKLHLADDRKDEFHLQIVKVQRILSELMGSLRVEVAGEIAENLIRLYEFMITQLALAMIRKNTEPVDIVLQMLEELRSAWQGAIDQTNEQPEVQPEPAAVGAEGQSLINPGVYAARTAHTPQFTGSSGRVPLLNIAG
jgi:flagellar protein FliS